MVIGVGPLCWPTAQAVGPDLLLAAGQPEGWCFAAVAVAAAAAAAVVAAAAAVVVVAAAVDAAAGGGQHLHHPGAAWSRLAACALAA